MSQDAPDGAAGSPAVGFVVRRSDDSAFRRHFSLPLGSKRVRIGRDESAEVYVTLNGVSSVHAELLVAEKKNKGPRLHVCDVSVNGTGLKLPDGTKVVLSRGVNQPVPDGAELLLPMRAQKSDKDMKQERRMFVTIELDAVRQARAARKLRKQEVAEALTATKDRKKPHAEVHGEAGAVVEGSIGETGQRLDAAALALHDRKIAAEREQRDSVATESQAPTADASGASTAPARDMTAASAAAVGPQAKDAGRASSAEASATSAAQVAASDSQTLPRAAATVATAAAASATSATPSTASVGQALAGAAAPAEPSEHAEPRPSPRTPPEPAPPPVRHWSVCIDRSAGGKLGISMNTTTLLVEKVVPSGLVDVFNAANPAVAIQQGDRVLSVNGVSTPAQIVAECKQEQLLQFILRRKVLDEKTEEPLLIMSSPAAAVTGHIAQATARPMAPPPTVAAPMAAAHMAPAPVAPAVMAPAHVAPHLMAPLMGVPTLALPPAAAGPSADVPKAMAPITPGAPQPKGMRSSAIAPAAPSLLATADGSAPASSNLLFARAVLAASSISVAYQPELPVPMVQGVGAVSSLAPEGQQAPTVHVTVQGDLVVQSSQKQTEQALPQPTGDSSPAVPLQQEKQMQLTVKRPLPRPPEHLRPSKKDLQELPPMCAPRLKPPGAPPGPPHGPSPGRPPGPPLGVPTRDASRARRDPKSISSGPADAKAIVSQAPKTPPGKPGLPRKRKVPPKATAEAERDWTADEWEQWKDDLLQEAASEAAEKAPAREDGSRTKQTQAHDDTVRQAAASKALGDDGASSSKTRSPSPSCSPRRASARHDRGRRSRSQGRGRSRSRSKRRSRSRSISRRHRQKEHKRSRSGSKRRDRPPRRLARSPQGQKRSRSRGCWSRRPPELSSANSVPIGAVPRPTCPGVPPVLGPRRPAAKLMTAHSKMPGTFVMPPPPPPLSMVGHPGMMSFAPMQQPWGPHVARQTPPAQEPPSTRTKVSVADIARMARGQALVEEVVKAGSSSVTGGQSTQREPLSGGKGAGVDMTDL